jgi:hypothetical protein
MENLVIYPTPRIGNRTPWGIADEVVVINPAASPHDRIYRVDTPSHGGYYVPYSMLSRIPKEHQKRAAKWSGSRYWYEEDCEWASVCVAYPEFFPADALEYAKAAIEWRHKI